MTNRLLHKFKLHVFHDRVTVRHVLTPELGAIHRSPRARVFMLVCKCEPMRHASPSEATRVEDVEEVECGAVVQAVLHSAEHKNPAHAAPRPPPRPLTRPCR
eukprot:950374-Prymnesium_polylepis.1